MGRIREEAGREGTGILSFINNDYSFSTKNYSLITTRSRKGKIIYLWASLWAVLDRCNNIRLILFSSSPFLGPPIKECCALTLYQECCVLYQEWKDSSKTALGTVLVHVSKPSNPTSPDSEEAVPHTYVHMRTIPYFGYV